MTALRPRAPRLSGAVIRGAARSGGRAWLGPIFPVTGSPAVVLFAQTKGTSLVKMLLI